MKVTLIYLCAFLTGATTLGFQVQWLRGLGIILGSQFLALGTVLAIFMLGLSLGSSLAKYLIEKVPLFTRRPVLSYTIFELSGSFISAISIYSVFEFTNFNFWILTNFKSQLIANIFISVLYMLFPCVLLGAGLPFLGVLDNKKEDNFSLSKVYALNIFGGAFGIIVFGLVLTFYIGFVNSAIVQFLINIIVFIFLFLNKQTHLKAQTETASQLQENNPLNSFYYLLAFISGFLFFSFELATERVVGLILGDRAYITSIVLVFVLLSMGIVSIIVSRLKKNSNLILYAFILSFFGLFIIGTVPDSAFYSTIELRTYTTPKIILLLYGIIPCLFGLSFFFPITLEFIKSYKPSKLGHLLWVNTLGCVLGSLVTSYVVISNFGIKNLFMLCVVVLSSIFVLYLNYSKKSKRYYLAAILVIPVIILLNRPVQIAPSDQILSSKETSEGILTLIKRKSLKEIYVGNYNIMNPFGIPITTHVQNSLAFFPAVHKSNIENVLVIGLGYGITANAFQTTEANHIDVVEIIPGMKELGHHFTSKNEPWRTSNNIHYHVQDGLRFLAEAKLKYDIISVNLISPYSVNGEKFLTKEIYELIASKLKPDGLMTQLIWGKHKTEMIHTLQTQFKYIKAMVGYSKVDDLILIASNHKLNQFKDYNFYKDQWTPHASGMTYAELIAAGTKSLEVLLQKKPNFIISTKYPKLSYGLYDHLGFLWFRD